LGAAESGPRAGDIGFPQRTLYRAALIFEGFSVFSRSIMTELFLSRNFTGCFV
jgi:hypothetical protein